MLAPASEVSGSATILNNVWLSDALLEDSIFTQKQLIGLFTSIKSLVETDPWLLNHHVSPPKHAHF